MSLSHSPSIVTNGLVLCLDAANTESYPRTGSAWTDLSNNGNNATLINGPSFSSDNRGVLSFNGSNQNAQIANNAAISLVNSSFTLSIWINFIQGININTDTSFIHKWNGNGYTLQIFQGALTTVLNGSVLKGTTLLTSNVWYNCVATYDRAFLTLYLNGRLENTKAETSSANNSNNNLVFGGRSDSVQNTNCLIPAIQIYNRALTLQEVLQNYNANRSRFGL